MNLKKIKDDRANLKTAIGGLFQKLLNPVSDSVKISDSEFLSLVDFCDLYNIEPEMMLSDFDHYASIDERREFMNHLSDAFDEPESLDDYVLDYCSNQGLNYFQVLTELDHYLSQDEIKEFIDYLNKNYDFDVEE